MKLMTRRAVALFVLSSLTAPLMGAAAPASAQTPASAPSVAPAAKTGGAIVTITGSGKVTINGAEIMDGATLYSGDRIVTERKVRAVLTRSENPIQITIGETTRADYVVEGDVTRLRLECGNASATAPANRIVEFLSDDDSRVQVREGAVDVTARGETKRLSTAQEDEFNGLTRVVTAQASNFWMETEKCRRPVAIWWLSSAALLLLLGGKTASNSVTGPDVFVPVVPPVVSASSFG